MRLFVTIACFVALIILYDRNIAQGALIKKDVSQHPIHISAGSISTWQKDGVRIFSAAGNVKIEQGDVQITSDSIITWFSEIKITQFTEGHMEILCEGNVSLIQEDSFDNYEEVYLKLITTSGVVFEPSVQSFEEEQRPSLYLRGEAIRAKGMEEFASEEILQVPDLPGQPASVDAEAAGELIDITADDIDSWEEGDTRVIVALGNVKFKKGDETLDADSAILYMDLEKSEKGKSPKQTYKEIYAEGNVTLVQGDDLIIADKIFDNVKENKGLFVNSTITSILKPPVVKQ